MKKNDIEFIKAKNLLTAFFKRDLIEFTQHPEFYAAISHFHIEPNNCPPLMKRTVHSCLLGFFRNMYINEIKRLSIGKNTTRWQRILPFTDSDIPYSPTQNAEFTFIDLFVGIGGLLLAFFIIREPLYYEYKI